MAAPNTPSRHAAKLSSRDVASIRSIGYRKTAKQIASMYGVHYRTIEKIRAHETWGHV